MKLSDEMKISIGIFLFAWAVRLAIFFIGDYKTFSGDEGMYWFYARRMVAGNYYTDVFVPGWPFVLSLALRISNTVLAARMLVMFLGALNCGLVAWIGARQFGLRVALIAGLIHSLYPEHFFSSHYLYAETSLETIILAATSIAFGFRAKTFGTGLLVGFSFLCGIGCAYKHFAVVPFAAMVGTILIHRRDLMRSFIFMAPAFLLPLIVYSAALKMTGNDPFSIVGSPLTAMRAWQLNHIAKPIRPHNEMGIGVGLSHLKETATASPGYIFARFWSNVRRLWGSDAYPLYRLRKARYSPLISPFLFIAVHQWYFGALLLAGITGFFISGVSPFKTFSMLSILLLTLMCSSFLMVPRYRLPFMFGFSLFGAYCLSDWRKTVLLIKNMNHAKMIVWIVALISTVILLLNTTYT